MKINVSTQLEDNRGGAGKVFLYLDTYIRWYRYEYVEEIIGYKDKQLGI